MLTKSTKQNELYGKSSGWRRRLLLAMVVFSVSLMVASILLLLQLAYPVLADPGTIIDSFDVTQALTQTTQGSTSGVADGTTGLLGGERDIVLTKTNDLAGSVTVWVNRDNNSKLSHSQDSNVTAETLVTYDGNDNNATTLAPNGLGGQDLTENGTNNAFHLEIVSADFETTITITVYTDYVTKCSSLGLDTPSGWEADYPPQSLIFPFAKFTQGSGCSSPAVFTDVGAITLFIEGDTPATDLTFEKFEAISVDFGDLPNPTANAFPDYQITMLSDNGAAHVISDSLKLGDNIDKEDDGQESVNADGDDTNGTDDEDGVVRTSGFKWGTTISGVGSVDVTVTGPLSGCLSAWIDWRRDEDFDDSSYLGANENIIDYVPVVSGTRTFTFTTPTDFPAGDGCYFARFRLFPRRADGTCNDGGADTSGFYVGQYPAGEVEDYRWCFGPNAITSGRLKATSASSRFPVNPVAVTLALLASGMVVGSMLVLCHRGHK